MNKLVQKIKETSMSHGSIPFWSWNDKLNEDELRRQIRNMHDMKMQGFFMHARAGLETEYLSDEWYSAVAACIDEAKKLGMQAWSYDENGWPSGFAGGKLLSDADNHATFVEAQLSEQFPTKSENTLAIYAFSDDGIPTPIEKDILGCQKYLHITVGKDSSYVDTMRADITDKFIEATHEEYKKRFPDDFGGAMPGFFTDEPQYYRWRTPYSKYMDEWFMEEYGYSVIEALPALFCDYPGACERRYDYHKMTTKKFTENFSKRLYDWHEKNGVRLTGHFVQEDSLWGQLMCCGEIMPQYMYEHIPGVDYLGRELVGDLAFKQLGSVAAQVGKKTAMSEMFACCGWDVSPRELKRIAELQYSGGVNLTCQHLYPVSIRGQRKRDYPAFYSEHNRWQRHLAHFNEYFNNLGAILAMGREYANVLVIHPMHSAWLYFQRVNMENSVKALDDELAGLVKLLSGNQICYHFGSETMMRDMAKVTGDKISVGLCSYDTVIIPGCDTLDGATVELLRKYISGGGKVYTCNHHLPTRIDGRLADLSFLEKLDDISDKNSFESLRSRSDIITESADDISDVRMQVRETEYGRIIYLTNLSYCNVGFTLRVKNCKGLCRLDIESLEASATYGRLLGCDSVAELLLRGGESIVLSEYQAPEFLSRHPRFDECIKLKNGFTLDKLPENSLTLDRARVSRGGSEFSELKPIEEIRDELLSERYSGELTLSFPFDITDVPERLELISEPSMSKNISVNGKEVTHGSGFALDRSFSLTDISQLLGPGENRINITLDYHQSDYVYYVLYGGVSESLRNCLVFDTEIECMYLKGSFALDMKAEDFEREEKNAYRYDAACGMSLIKQKPTLNVENIVTDGYLFFSGEISISTTLDYKAGDPTLLHIGGRYSTAEVNVNGKLAGVLVLSEYIDIKDYLSEGENKLTLTLCNNHRNLLGPHHNIDPEPLAVSPPKFSFEGMWHNGECADFDSRYSFIRFGIDV